MLDLAEQGETQRGLVPALEELRRPVLMISQLRLGEVYTPAIGALQAVAQDLPACRGVLGIRQQYQGGGGRLDRVGAGQRGLQRGAGVGGEVFAAASQPVQRFGAGSVDRLAARAAAGARQAAQPGLDQQEAQ